MLATLGFLITATLLALFASMFDGIVKKMSKSLRLFGLAYFLIAIAFLMWGILSVSNANSLLPHSVLVGDALLFLASICSALVFTPKKWKILVGISSIIAAAVLLFVRAKYYFPVPYLRDGILFFNTQGHVVVLLSIILVVAWFPSCLKVARIITSKANLGHYYSLYVLAYALPVITAVLFVEARRKTIIIESFVCFGVSIILLLLSNIIILNNNSSKAQNAAK